MREVLFFNHGDGSPLLCSDIRRDEDGTMRAHVVNGNWTLNYKPGNPGRLRAYAGSHLVTDMVATVKATVEIPEGMKGDYNQLIGWARAKVAAT